ncbi:MAG: PorV/PorQ family protein [Saprospiraceae bacterium]|nr:PorV/PorQ family protein [Saprospiraceae bacterium]
MRFRQIIFFVFLCLSYGQSDAQVKYSNEFLSIGVGARALAMGNAVSASANDVTANFWNPAGLSQIEAGLQVAAMHTSWFSGVGNYDYIGLAKTLHNNQAISVGIIRFGIDGIPNTLSLIDENGEINYDRIKTFSAVDYGIFGSYARALKNPAWRIGGSVKVVSRKIGTFANAIGFGIDLGIQHLGPKWYFGIMGKDITTTFNTWNGTFTEAEKAVLTATGNDVVVKGTEITRPTIILAGGIKTAVGKKGEILFELNLDATTDGKRNTLISSDPVSINPHLGAEYRYKHLFFLRGGINNIQQITDITTNKKSWTVQPNVGIGLGLGSVNIDYALTNIGNVSETRLSHVFSLKLSLTPKAKVAE